jgi:hypothetical protein
MTQTGNPIRHVNKAVGCGKVLNSLILIERLNHLLPNTFSRIKGISSDSIPDFVYGSIQNHEK